MVYLAVVWGGKETVKTKKIAPEPYHLFATVPLLSPFWPIFVKLVCIHGH